jgi:hypothetical protein
MAAEEKLNKHATHRIVLTQCGHRFFTSGRPFHDRCFDQSDTSCSEERGKGIHISRFNREEGCRERERFSEKKNRAIFFFQFFTQFSTSMNFVTCNASNF